MRILLALIAVLSLTSLLLAQEQLTISTYYPSPYGSYNELQLIPHNPATSSCTTAADGGKIYFDDSVAPNRMKVCDNVGGSWGWHNLGGGSCLHSGQRLPFLPDNCSYANTTCYGAIQTTGTITATCITTTPTSSVQGIYRSDGPGNAPSSQTHCQPVTGTSSGTSAYWIYAPCYREIS
jgi:hypothetical protein